jgi:hypothetical protein
MRRGGYARHLGPATSNAPCTGRAGVTGRAMLVPEAIQDGYAAVAKAVRGPTMPLAD